MVELKQSWEMTQAEWVENFVPSPPDFGLINPDGTIVRITYEDALARRLINRKRYERRFSGLTEKQYKQMIGIANHHNAVFQALMRGEKVPDKVLVDYPELPAIAQRLAGESNYESRI